MYPAASGTFSLNKTLPTVVSTILSTKLFFESKSFVLTFMVAFKFTFFSLYAITTSSGE